MTLVEQEEGPVLELEPQPGDDLPKQDTRRRNQAEIAQLPAVKRHFLFLHLPLEGVQHDRHQGDICQHKQRHQKGGAEIDGLRRLVGGGAQTVQEEIGAFRNQPAGRSGIPVEDSQQEGRRALQTQHPRGRRQHGCQHQARRSRGNARMEAEQDGEQMKREDQGQPPPPPPLWQERAQEQSQTGGIEQFRPDAVRPVEGAERRFTHRPPPPFRNRR